MLYKNLDLNKKNIILWTGSFYPQIGGLEVAGLEYANYFFNKGWNVTVITNKNPYNLISKENMGGIIIKRFLFLHNPISYIKNYRFDLFFSWFFFKPYTILKLFIFFFIKRPKIVNLHFPDHQLFEILILKSIFNFKLITSLHGNEVDRIKQLKRYHIKNFLYDNIFNKSSYITGCSNYLIQQITALYKEKYVDKYKVIYNGTRIGYNENGEKINRGEFIFSAMRFVPIKGLDLLLRSISILKNENNLFIAGGSQKEAEKIVGLIKNADNIKFLGSLKSNEIIYYLKRTKVTVIPSKSESLGIFLIEALCCASPIVATNVGGIPEVIKLGKKHLNFRQKKIFDKYVKIVNPDVESITCAIKLILNQKDNLEDFQNLAPNFKRVFDWEINLKEFYKLIKSI